MVPELIREEINLFIENESPQVIAIKGRWGVGKTFLWGSQIQECKSKIQLKKYAYVSLFGLKSNDDIKRCIFENTIDTAYIGEINSLESLAANYKSVSKKYSRKSSEIIKGSASAMTNLLLRGIGSSTEKVLDSISFAMISNTLICFDDIERHSKGVSLRDFLGLVTYLKEQKKCKVVILLNEDSDDLLEYQQYKEKVIDKQYHYEPSSEYCFDIATPDKKVNGYEHIKDVCVRLDIRNIRVMRKINSHINSALSAAVDFDSSIKEQIIQTIIIICWAHYCHSSDYENIPSLSYLKKISSSNYLTENFDVFYNDEEKNVKTDEEKKEEQWGDLLRSYNYQSYHDLTPILISSVEQGFINKQSLKITCQKDQDEINIRISEKKYGQAWECFHGSFGDNADEVIEKMKDGLECAVESLSISQYRSGVKLIKDLGNESLADDLTELYIYRNKDNIEKLNTHNEDFNPYGKADSEFDKKIQAYYDAAKVIDSAESILERRKNSNTYNKHEVDTLEKTSLEDLIKLFHSFEGKDLADKIRVCLMLASSSTTLMSNVKSALISIGNENKLNKMRLEKFKF